MTKTDEPIVVVVDDDERFLTFLRIAAKTLLQQNWQIAKTGQELIDIIVENKDRIFSILLDWDLGGELSGLKLIDEVQRLAGYRAVIYILSDKISIQEEGDALHAGAYCRFLKNEDPYRLELYTGKDFVLRLIRRQNTDEKTGLLNFSAFTLLAKSELEGARQSYERQDEKHPQSFALLFIDIDKFKSINDLHGHSVGDLAIQRVAQIIRERVRPADHPCRTYKGDEFAVWLADTNLEGAERIGRKVKAAVAREELCTEEGIIVPLSISFGVATIEAKDIGPFAGMAFQKLYREADEAMYKVKPRDSGARENRGEQ